MQHLSSARPRRRLLAPLLALAATLPLVGCGGGGGAAAPAPTPTPLPTYTYRVVHAWPHDPSAFTEGLAFDGGNLYEGTGLTGASDLREETLDTDQALRRVSLPSAYFGEGVTVLGGRIYQLTWQSHVGFVYDLGTFQQVGQFTYDGEGWGLTQDGTSLIMSDGTDKLRFLDPGTFRVTKTLPITANGAAVTQINELEYVSGRIYANIWHSNEIAEIDPQTGHVVAWIDLTSILPASARSSDPEAVLNGIAYDAQNDRLFVTGKLWPTLFEIQIMPK